MPRVPSLLHLGQIDFGDGSSTSGDNSEHLATLFSRLATLTCRQEAVATLRVVCVNTAVSRLSPDVLGGMILSPDVLGDVVVTLS